MTVEFAVEIKAHAIAELATGTTYRQAQLNIEQRFKVKPDLHTLWNWWHEDPQRVAEHNAKLMQLQMDRDLRTISRAGELIDEKLDSANINQLIIAKGVTQDKVHATLRLLQDEKKSNSLLEAIRMAKQLPADERARLAVRVFEPEKVEESTCQ